jgi:hypothetical protein
MGSQMNKNPLDYAPLLVVHTKGIRLGQQSLVIALFCIPIGFVIPVIVVPLVITTFVMATVACVLAKGKSKAAWIVIVIGGYLGLIAARAILMGK